MTAPRVLGPSDGKAGALRSMGVRFMIDGDDSGGGPPNRAQILAIAERYGLEFDFESILRLLEEHGLNFGPPQ